MADENKKYDRFGRYLILDHLVDGGMAQINRARFLGEQADKVVAIKMVRPQFSQDEGFKTMFMDEIKVTFDLIHPNIVQTYDYGIHDEQLFVAMEYCDGRNLKQYLDKLKEKKFVFPVEISVYIITQVCQGLHYAHTKTDQLTGKTSNIIHRDISPHNIMLTFDGAVKVIDFGIAKAESNSESTQAGTIKGKLSYLAPEYLEGHELDPRYDEFAVGITLWEMLCCRKLFKAANDLAVLKKIQACQIPAPSSINPNVPKELDEIVLKSLSKNREKRYKDMEQFNRALVKFLYSHYPEFNANDLSYFAKELFKEEIAKDREKLIEFGKINLGPYLEDLKKEKEGNPNSDNQSVLADSEGLTRKEINIFDFGFENEGQTRKFSLRDKVKKEQEEKAKKEEKQDKEEKTPEKKEKAEFTAEFDLGSPSSLDIDLPAENKPTKRGVVKAKRPPQRPVGKKKASSSKKKTNKKRGRTNPKKSSGGARRVILLGALVASLAVVFYNDLPPQVREVISPLLSQAGIELVPPAPMTNKRTPSSSKKKKNDANKIKSKVLIENYDFLNHKVYFNGQQLELDASGIITKEFDKNKTYYIRVEIKGKETFVYKIDGSNLDKSISFKIPETKTMLVGYLNTSRPCLSGELVYELFGEPRTVKLPLKGNLNFPINVGEDGGVISTQYEIGYIEEGATVPKKVSLVFEQEDVVQDLCAIIFGN